MGRLDEIERAIELSESPTSEEMQTINAHGQVVVGLVEYLGKGAERLKLPENEPKVYSVDEYTAIDKAGTVKSTIGITLSRVAMEFDVYTKRNPTNSGSGPDALTWLVSMPKAQISVELYENLVRVDNFYTSVGNYIERAARVNARR